MRIKVLLLAIAAGLMPALVVAQNAPATASPAQAPAPAAEPDADALPTTYGSLDFGVRGTHMDGDGARYERYRDMSDGLFLELARYNTQKNGWLVELGGDHLFRRDQKYTASFVRPGTVKVWGLWDQIPMLMSRTTQTLFLPNTAPGVLEIDDAIQAQTQANAAYLATAVQSARTFDLKSQRHIFNTGVEYIAKNGLTLTADTRYTQREGNLVYGGSFGHSNVVETIAPVQHNLTDFGSTAEFGRGDLLVRGGYDGSWFHNEVSSLTFDNPWRVTDISGTGSRGRFALAPDNSFIGVNGLVSYRMPGHSRVSLYGSIHNLRDTGDALLPFTVNTALVSPPLDRQATEGEAQTSSVNMTFTSRPTRILDFDVRYRTYDYDNRTPEFLVTKRVAYDNAVSDVTNPALQETEPFGVKRDSLDADMRVSLVRALTAGIGFSHMGEERTHRIFESTSDNTIRLTVDSIGIRWLTLRSKYEHSEKRGEGDPTLIGAELLAIGEQPGMRHFDLASRNRDRVTMTGALTPFNTLSFDASFAAGKDDFIESEFGLRDSTHKIYSLGMEYAPSEYFGAGVSYSYERYKSLSRSRQASSNAEFVDPSRNWATDSSDHAHSVIGHLELLKYIRHTDVILFADYSRTRGTHDYLTGPVPDRTLPDEVTVPTTLPPPTELPPNSSGLGRVNLDVNYSLSERWSVGVSYWYERYRVEDFTLDANAQNRLDPAGALLIGYQYLPYTAQTFWGRAIYKF